MDRFLFRVSAWMVVITMAFLLLLAVINKAHAQADSFLCKTLDTNEYVDVVTSGTNNKVLVQINGGRFLEGSAEFKDPLLYIFVPLTNGNFGIVFNVREHKAVSVAVVNGNKQVHEMTCTFRD